MNAPVLPIALVLCLSPFASAQEASPADGLAAIVEKNIAADVQELASDAYMGRSCPTPGYMRAAEFVAARFEKLGLKPGGSDPEGEHPYFRYWEREATVPTPDCELAFDMGDGLTEFIIEKDWIPLVGCAEGPIEGDLVFVGYAIDAKKERYRDVDGAKLRNKIAIAFWHEPRENQKGKKFDGKEWTKHASARQKAAVVRDKGAVALILINDPLHEPHDRPPLFQFPRFKGWNGGPRDKAPEFPVIFVSLEVGQRLTGMDLIKEHARIDKSLKCKAQALEGRRAKIDVSFQKVTVRTPNVIGVVPGTGETGRAVVVAAHLDHAGADDGGRIWNGADDNASGTSALLAVAAAFSASPPKRDTVLISMAAEEWGLWGSEAYAEDPHVPLDVTDFMMNIDMVGRGKTKEFAVMGAWGDKALQKIIKTSAKLVGSKLKLDTDGGRQFWKRSDQYNFFKHGVPALFVSEVGIEHEDYHRPTDTADKIDTKKATYAAKLAFSIVWTISNLDEPLPRLETSSR